MPDPQIFLSGRFRPEPGRVPLRAGPLTMEFDPSTLALRYVRLGTREVLRSIYAAVRDRNWGTVCPKVSDLQIDASADRFRIEFTATCRRAEIAFRWRGALSGDEQGTVRFAFDGEALTPFLRNRIGLCVLHPIVECAGQPCQVERVDGIMEQAAFPLAVAPFQPFRQVRALRHKVEPGVEAEVRFVGDVFETEDQRNWTDASFKTYSTPLDLPFPVRLEQGATIHQEVSLILLGAPERSAVETADETPRLEFTTERKLPMPPLGLCLAHQGPLSAREIQRLRALDLSHLRADLHLERSGWREELGRASTQAEEIGVGLHLALHFSSAGAASELIALREAIAGVPARVTLWLVHQDGPKTTPRASVRLVQDALTASFPDTPFAAGTDAYFAELNRSRPEQAADALPCFSLNPQVHGVDDATLVENLGGQKDPVETAWGFTGRRVVVSPVTLRPRFNPNATAAAAGESSIELPSQVDVRQMSLLGAGWTLGSVAALAGTGHIHSLTYYETLGWRGVMETEAGSPQPDRFPSVPGAVFPMYHVFADLAGGASIYALIPPSRGAWAILGLGDSRRLRRVLLANLQPKPQTLRVALAEDEVRLRLLHAGTVDEAMRDPEGFRARPMERLAVRQGSVELEIPPFALATVELGLPAGDSGFAWV